LRSTSKNFFQRIKIKLKTGAEVYVRYLKMSRDEAVHVLNKYSMHGAIVEPLRVARLLARAVLKSLIHPKTSKWVKVDRQRSYGFLNV
jgi:ribosomal protein L15E